MLLRSLEVFFPKGFLYECKPHERFLPEGFLHVPPECSFVGASVIGHISRQAIPAGFWRIPADSGSGTLFLVIPAPTPCRNYGIFFHL